MKKLIVIFFVLISSGLSAQEWISNGESGLSVRNKLNALKGTVDTLVLNVDTLEEGIILIGDATGAGTKTITVTVVDDSHNHTIANVDNLHDSLTTFWEKEVALDDENNWTVPFSIKTTAIIIYNGSPLRSAQWGGEGSTVLGVSLTVRKYDHLVLIN